MIAFAGGYQIVCRVEGDVFELVEADEVFAVGAKEEASEVAAMLLFAPSGDHHEHAFGLLAQSGRIGEHQSTEFRERIHDDEVACKLWMFCGNPKRPRG